MVAVLVGGHDKKHRGYAELSQHGHGIAELARQRVVKRQDNAIGWEVVFTAHTGINTCKAHWLESGLDQASEEASEAGLGWHLVRVEHRANRGSTPNCRTVRQPIQYQRGGVRTPPVQETALVQLPAVVAIGKYRGAVGG